MTDFPLTGGCLCGDIRYRIDGPLIDAGLCHCTLCRRATGAPVVAWLTIPRAGFAYTKGKARVRRSSDKAEREFCPECGTALVFRFLDPTRPLDVTIASLDTPEAVAPDYQIWTASRIPWMERAHALPAYPDAGRDA